MTINDLLSRLAGVRKSGAGWTAKCPAHDDRRASLSVSESGGKLLLKCHAGCSCEAVAGALGLRMSDLFSETDRRRHESKRTVTAEYVYKNLHNEPEFKKVRYSDKSFMWQHMDKGVWVNGRGGNAAPLYNQFDAYAYERVYCVEGEKDVETLRRYGVPAVSLPDGCKTKWQPEYTEWFRHRRVYILPDNDAPGRQCALETAGNIYGAAEQVKLIDLSEIWDCLPEKGDISDYLQEFGQEGMERLERQVNCTPDWTPELLPEQESFENDGIIRLSEVEESETEWLWYPYIPRGKITLLTADPGLGKTFFALYLAACVSTGRPFWGSGQPWREPEKAVYQTAEDGVADTIKPRLAPMQPNFANILMIDETNEGLTLSDERIAALMQRHRPALLIFDPLQAYLGADVDMHRANEVRPILAHLAKLAETYDTAVILIMHNSKTSQNKALYRALGTIDIPAVARSMLVMGRDPENDSRRVLCHEKSSLARQGRSLTFEVAPAEGGLSFKGFSDLTADDVLTPAFGGRDKPSVKLDEACGLLTGLLGEKGWCEYGEVKELAEEYGVSMTTFRNAKKEMELQSVKVGYDTGSSYWLLPDIDREQFRNDMCES